MKYGKTNSRDVILAVHLYEEGKTVNLLNKIEPLINIATEVWFSSTNNTLLAYASKFAESGNKKMRIFEVDNRWHDWSGYLDFLRAYDPANQLIICNDSIVSRRVISNRTLRNFVSALSVETPAIIGELDSATCSVDLNGWSSACWISTYMFAIQGISIDVKQLEPNVENDVQGVISNPSHFFNRYVANRRANVVIREDNKKAKLGAMFFERRLTRLAIEDGIPVINFCAGSKVRKIERILERLLDA